MRTDQPTYPRDGAINSDQSTSACPVSGPELCGDLSESMLRSQVDLGDKRMFNSIYKLPTSLARILHWYLRAQRQAEGISPTFPTVRPVSTCSQGDSCRPDTSVNRDSGHRNGNECYSEVFNHFSSSGQSRFRPKEATPDQHTKENGFRPQDDHMTLRWG